jgi:hypothetical protein
MPGFAVQGHGEDARGGCLPHPAGPAQEVPVRDAPLRDGAPQRARDVLLADEVGEGARTVLPGEGDVHYGRGEGRGARDEVVMGEEGS